MKVAWKLPTELPELASEGAAPEVPDQGALPRIDIP